MALLRNPSVNQPLVDPQTGIIKTEWLRFLTLLATSGPQFDLRSGPPANPAESQSYYDTSLHKARTWDGAIWQNWW